MIQKVLVEIRIPAADAKFDAFIPMNSKGYDVVKIISNIFTKKCEGKYMANNDSVICIYDIGKILDINKKIYEQDIKNGTVLILI